MKKWLLSPAFLALGLCATWSVGQEPVIVRVEVDVDEDGQDDVITGLIQLAVDRKALHANLPSHWIGISGSAIDGLLKKHLKIEGGVLVEWVAEDSPAAKAGIQVDDIVVSVQGKPVSDIATIAQLVGNSKSLKLIVLHNGDEKSVKLTPEKRPADAAHGLHFSMRKDADVVGKWLSKGAANPKELHKWLQELHVEGVKQGADKGTTILRLMPGGIIGKDAAKVLQGLHHFNAGLDAKNHVLRMIVQKTDDKTKVTVTQDGKTWTVNDKNLNDLPEGLREKVKSILERSKTDFKGVIEKAIPGSQIRVRLFGGDKHAIVVQPEEKKDQPSHRIRIIRSTIAGDAGSKQPENLPQQIQIIRATSSGDAVSKQLEQLRKELAALRKEVRALKKD